jgi:hypothetical protein
MSLPNLGDPTHVSSILEQNLKNCLPLFQIFIMEFKENSSQGVGFQTNFNNYLRLCYKLTMEEKITEEDDTNFDNFTQENK